MTLLGKGVLAIWNGISPAFEREFEEWHVREHIPQRMGLPGFLRGRRYIAAEGHPRYFNFYEAASSDVFSSCAYLKSLDNPTPWTKTVVVNFKDTSRTICDVSTSVGRGQGAFIRTMQLASENEGFLERCIGLCRELVHLPGIVGAHLLRGRQSSVRVTAEMNLRGAVDTSADWILLVESISMDSLAEANLTLLSEAVLESAGAELLATGGTYRLQFALAQGE